MQVQSEGHRMIPKSYLDKALAEQATGKTLHDIQVETAFTWAARACVAARLDLHEDAKEYRHEALEHAALSGDDALLKLIRAAMASFGVRG